MAGFYGNITNTARTQFQFDVIYSSRKFMDDNCTIDGIYPGRYALVEYDKSFNLEQLVRVVLIDNKLYYYEDQQREIEYGTQKINNINITISINDILYSSDFDNISSIKQCSIYKVEEQKDEGVNFIQLIEAGVDTSDDTYAYNNIIDKMVYKTGRGYDSTVWQKTYIDGEEKYIMIAELNSVVPEFGIAVEAPQMTPIAPHFDKTSSNIYYKLHLSPSWGFKIKEAEDNDFSDEEASYLVSELDESQEIITVKESEKYPANIFFNKAGFNKEKSSYSNKQDLISITPTGKSGTKYENHNQENANNIDKSVQPDMLELSILLPSIGNAINDFWNLIYGDNESTTQKRNLDISWKEAGSLQTGSVDLETVAGCINAVHELMGMIITDKDTIAANENNYNNHYLYKDTNDDYWRIAKEQTYNFENQYDGENTTEYDIFGSKGQIIYKFVKIPNASEKLKSIYGSILKMNELLGIGLEDTKDRSTIYGCINSLQSLINTFENKFKVSSPVIINNEGKFSSASWDTIQNAEIRNWAKNDEVTRVENTQWITCSVDGTTKQIQIHHVKPIGIAATRTVKDLNDDDSNGFMLYSPAVDNTGHVVTRNEEVITLPYGYKTFQIGVISNSSEDAPTLDTPLDLIASNTKDNISIAPSNKWIGIYGENRKEIKEIEIGHETHFDPGQADIVYGLEENKENAKTFSVPNFSFDEAGHITNAETYSITIPAPSLNIPNYNDASVITKIELSDSNFNQTIANIGTLKIAGYSEASENEKISETDTINMAFGKTQKQIDDEIINRSNAISSLESTIVLMQERIETLTAEIEVLKGAN